jgi:uncharacterized protein YjbJ (UPF0337 family)
LSRLPKVNVLNRNAQGMRFNHSGGFMNQDRFEGNWMQFKGKVKEQWGKLTDDDLDIIAGKRDQLLGRIQERHGLEKDEAEKQVVAFHERNPTNFFERY